MELPAISIKVAAVLFLLNAAGFGLPTLPVARHLVEHGELPQVFGFRAYGGGSFERFGVTPFAVLLGAFLMVCIGEAITGWLLWTGQRSGGILALALLPVCAAFWVGFALPYAGVNGLVRTALVALGWSSLGP